MSYRGPCEYVVDRRDAIQSVNDRWLAFACENGAAGLTRESVLGRPVWDYIVDKPTQEVYRRLFRKVRRSQLPMVMPFRCDSKALRREMRIVLLPLWDDAVAISCRTISVKPRAPVRLLDPECERSDQAITICSFCKRALIEGRLNADGDSWFEIEEAEQRLGLRPDDAPPRLRYDSCPSCTAIAQ